MASDIKVREGTRGKVYTAMVELPRDPVTGKRRQKRLQARTVKELKALTVKTEHEINTGGYIEPSKLTVGQWLTEWVSGHPVREASTVRYVGAINKRFIPAFGEVPILRLTPQRIQAAYKEWAEAGISSTTLAFYHSVLHKAFSQAVEQRLLIRNPLDSVQAPRPRHVEMQVWSAEEARDFLKLSADDEHAMLWALALHTGMRRGELLALRWSDVDLQPGYVSVQRTLTRTKKGFTAGEVKTRAARRRIRLGPVLTAQLRAHRQSQIEHRLRLGPAWEDHDLVFPREDGTQQVPEVTARRFKRLVQRLELHEIRFHDLRHTAATLMLANGERPKVVASRLGHSSIKITMDRYSHVTEEMENEAAERLEALLAQR